MDANEKNKNIDSFNHLDQLLNQYNVPAQHGLNPGIEKNFLEELQERQDKIEKLKNELKGNDYFLEDKIDSRMGLNDIKTRKRFGTNKANKLNIFCKTTNKNDELTKLKNFLGDSLLPEILAKQPQNNNTDNKFKMKETSYSKVLNKIKRQKENFKKLNAHAKENLNNNCSMIDASSTKAQSMISIPSLRNIKKKGMIITLHT